MDKRFAVKNSGMSCLTLVFNLSNLIMTILNAKHWSKVAKYEESYTVFGDRLIPTHGFVVSLMTWLRFLQGAETLLPIGHIA